MSVLKTGRRSFEATVPLRPRAVQPESRFRLSGEGDAATQALVHAAHLAASQKRALNVTVHQSTPSPKQIAEASGISYKFLCNAALTSTHDQLPFARLPLVLEASDDLTLLRFLADLQHADVLSRPRGAAIGDEARRQASADAVREFAEFMAAGATADAAEVLAPEVFARMEREGVDAIDAIRAHLAHHRARVQRPLLEGM